MPNDTGSPNSVRPGAYLFVQLGLLPECDARQCLFKMNTHEAGAFFEHQDKAGQSRGLLITNEELAKGTHDILAAIKPYYERLHDEDEAIA